MDELEEALKQNDITEDIYRLALSTKENLINDLLNDLPKLYEFCIQSMLQIEKSIPSN